ncbi:MAG: ABC transporter substrate-binding protein [Kosmotoga sp.]|nr:MAG: ABC transporter substrate-binding protein [Kosmotoga sp.]
MKRFLVILFVLLTVFSFSSTLKFAIETEPVGLDPNLVTAFASHRILENVYSGLLQYDTNMKLVPDLAKSFETPDAYTVIFTLRDNVYFHNGEKMTVEDVLYTFDRIRDPDFGSPAASYYENVESIKAIGDNKIEFKLTKPMVNALLHNFAGVNSSIVSEDFVESGANMQTETNGTGPFAITEYVSGDHITLSKHEDYFVEGIPYLDEIEFVIIPEEVSRVSALRNGDVDLAKINEPLSLDLLSTDKFKIYRQPVLSYYLLGINNNAGPLSDPRVRRALSYAIDREQIIKAVSFGEGTVTGVMNPTVKAWAIPPSEFPEYEYDPHKATELLKEAGYPDGFEFSITTASRYNFDKIAQVIQAQLSIIGVKVKIDLVEWGIFIDKWINIDFESFISLNSGSVSPDKQLYRTFHTTGSTNKFNFSNERVDELLEAGRTTTDYDTRREIYNELQRLLVEKSPIIFLYSPNILFASSDAVIGFETMSNESIISLRTTKIGK